MNYRSERQKLAILKPKYPVNAFNMFAKNEREALKKEFSQFSVRLVILSLNARSIYLTDFKQ